MFRVEQFQRTERFDRDFRRLPPDIQAAVGDALKHLIQHPLPSGLRHHTLSGHRPTVHVIDVMSNHSWQLTFNMEGTTAVLLRVDTHRRIDSNPKG